VWFASFFQLINVLAEPSLAELQIAISVWHCMTQLYLTLVGNLFGRGRNRFPAI